MKPTPTPPKTTLSHMPIMGMSPASGFRLSCMALTEPLLVAVVMMLQAGSPAGAVTQFLAFQIGAVLNIQAMEGGGRRAFKIYGATQLDAEQAQHHRENHGRMLHAARKPPEHPDTGHGDDDDGHGLDEVCEKARVFKRMRGVWPEKAAAVGAQLLNRHKSRYRATGNNLLGPLQGSGRPRSRQTS